MMMMEVAQIIMQVEELQVLVEAVGLQMLQVHVVHGM